MMGTAARELSPTTLSHGNTFESFTFSAPNAAQVVPAQLVQSRHRAHPHSLVNVPFTKSSPCSLLDATLRRAQRPDATTREEGAERFPE